MGEIVGALRGVHEDTEDLVYLIMSNKIYRIGKDKSSDIHIELKDLISETHCVIIPLIKLIDETCVYLTDTSTSGTYLNGCLIGQNKTVILHSGCIISFGSEHINLMFIQYRPDDVLFPEFTTPGYPHYPLEQGDTSRELSIRTTNKLIGKGSQSSIFLAYDQKNPTRQLVCKYTNLKKSQFMPQMTRVYETELSILKGNKHPNVISLVAHYKSEQEKFVYLPIYYGDSLYERFKENHSNKQQLNERDATFLIQQLFAGLDYLHDRDIIHCDLKPQNILLSERYTNRPRLIIADFGHSTYKSSKPKTWPESWGTYEYHAPEMVKLQEFSNKIDSWAAGMIFYEMLTGKHPFAYGLREETEKAILTEDIKLKLIRIERKDGKYSKDDKKHNKLASILENTSPNSKQIIACLTQKDQHQRFTIKQAMQIKTLFSWFGDDKKIAQDDYLTEREMWFHNEECSSSTPRYTRESIHYMNPDGRPDTVNTTKESRNPSHEKSFLFGTQGDDLSTYPNNLINRLNSFRNPYHLMQQQQQL
ncbi:hypothetical protein PS15p_205025 [Mucor circinelloides]